LISTATWLLLFASITICYLTLRIFGVPLFSASKIGSEVPISVIRIYIIVPYRKDMYFLSIIIILFHISDIKMDAVTVSNSASVQNNSAIMRRKKKQLIYNIQ